MVTKGNRDSFSFSIRRDVKRKGLATFVKKEKYVVYGVFLITLTPPMKMYTSLIKTNLPILFELLSVYIMNQRPL